MGEFIDFIWGLIEPIAGKYLRREHAGAILVVALNVVFLAAVALILLAAWRAT